MKLPRMAVMLMVRSTILLMAVKSYRDPVRAVRALKMLIRKRSALSGNSGLPSYFYGNGRYFLGPNVPGWPSSSFNRFIQNELNNSLPFKKDHSRLTTIIFSITKSARLDVFTASNGIDLTNLKHSNYLILKIFSTDFRYTE